MTIHDYIERKNILLNTPAILKNGKMTVLYNGKKIPAKKFDRMFSLPAKLNTIKENPDKTKA